MLLLQGVDTIEEQAVRLCECEAALPYVVENVPTYVCRLCGDKSYSGETLTTLEKIAKGEAIARNLQVISVFDFRRLEGATERRFGQGVHYTQSAHHTMEGEFPGTSGMIQIDGSSQWNREIMWRSGWTAVDKQSVAGFVYFRPMKAIQTFRISGFSNIVNREPRGSFWLMENNWDEVAKISLGKVHSASSRR